MMLIKKSSGIKTFLFCLFYVKFVATRQNENILHALRWTPGIRFVFWFREKTNIPETITICVCNASWANISVMNQKKARNFVIPQWTLLTLKKLNKNSENLRNHNLMSVLCTIKVKGNIFCLMFTELNILLITRNNASNIADVTLPFDGSKNFWLTV
jgi:hypothetical protein